MSAVTIRRGTPTDWPHVGDSFFRSYHTSPHARGTPAKVLAEALDSLLGSPQWVLWVACATEEPSEILGWLLARIGVPQRAAWCFVKPIWRGKGVGRALVRHAGITAGEVEVAFLEPEVAKWVKAKGLVLRLRPHLVAVTAYDAGKAVA